MVETQNIWKGLVREYEGDINAGVLEIKKGVDVHKA